MLTKKMIKRLKEVTQINAVSGLENALIVYLEKEFRKFGYEIITDHLGSLFALKKSSALAAPRVLVASHADEVGFVVTRILWNGTIKVAPRGGIDFATLLAQRVILTTASGKALVGAVNTVPPHLKKSGENPININMLSLDFGFASKQEAEEAGVKIGDMIVVQGEFKELNGGKRLLSKAFDNRYGVFMALEAAEYFKDKELPYDLYIGATVQEEVGLRGAKTMSNVVEPDFAIVLDCSPARDVFINEQGGGALGEGILLRYFDRSMIANPYLLRFQEQTAKEVKVATQYYMSPGGTDAGEIHLHDIGVPTLTHCVCARGLHTNSTVLDASDVRGARKVLLKMLEKLTPALIKEFKESKHV